MIQAATANLTALQEEAYDYIVKQQKVEYLKERLQTELNFNSIRAVTRSVNKLLELSLIKEIEEAGSIYLVDNQNETKTSQPIETPVAEEKTSSLLETLPIVDQRPLSEVSTLEEVLPSNVLSAMKNMTTEAVDTQENDAVLPDLTEKHHQFLQLIQEEEVVNGQHLVNNNATLAQRLNLSKLTLVELKRELIHRGYMMLCQKDTTSYIQLTAKGFDYLNQQPMKVEKPSAEKVEPEVSPVTKSSLSSDPEAFMLRSTYKILTPNEKAVYDALAKYLLANPMLKYCSYKRLNAIANMPSAQLKIIVLSLQQKKLIFLKGETDSTIFLRHGHSTISKVFPTWTIGKKPTLPASTPETPLKTAPDVSEPKTEAPSVVLTMPVAETSESGIQIILPTVEEFSAERCVYLVDTENTGLTYFIDPERLTHLSKDDSIVLLLSQKTVSISPERFHILMSAGCRIETEMIKVLGTGRSDLDHALIAELTIRLMQEPEAKYVILSKDKGYLGAISHLEKKLKLAPGQLTLRPHF